MRAIKIMKNEARDEPDASLKIACDINRKKCLDEGRAPVEGGPLLWILSDIVSFNGGGLLNYPNFRLTLTKIRETATPFLPVAINDMIFELQQYYEYNLLELKRINYFYNLTKKTKRILILMPQFGIDWLREFSKNHCDGIFD